MSGYRYVVSFEVGADAQGPWAVLGCPVPGCAAHQAVRPEWLDGRPGRDDDFLASLLDVAEHDGWEVYDATGPRCPAHRGVML